MASIVAPAPSSAVAAPEIHSLAVLPLKNLSGDPNQEYFADGTTLELITTLTKINNLSHQSRVREAAISVPTSQTVPHCKSSFWRVGSQQACSPDFLSAIP